jgi:hypothetical protein
MTEKRSYKFNLFSMMRDGVTKELVATFPNVFGIDVKIATPRLVLEDINGDPLVIIDLPSMMYLEREQEAAADA